MELKTDGGIYLTKELYRKYVKKVMSNQMKFAVMGTIIACLEADIDPDNAKESAKDALNLQVQVLKEMEDALFGNPEKDEEEQPQVPPKEEKKDEPEKGDKDNG